MSDFVFWDDLQPSGLYTELSSQKLPGSLASPEIFQKSKVLAQEVDDITENKLFTKLQTKGGFHMQVSGADSQAPFMPTHFFAEAQKDENTSRAQHAQSENHSREVDSHHAEGQEDSVNIQGNPDAVHGTAGTNHLEQDQTGKAKNPSSQEFSGQGEKSQQIAEEVHQAEQKARFFDRSGQLAEPQASASVVDVFG